MNSRDGGARVRYNVEQGFVIMCKSLVHRRGQSLVLAYDGLLTHVAKHSDVHLKAEGMFPHWKLHKQASAGCTAQASGTVGVWATTVSCLSPPSCHMPPRRRLDTLLVLSTKKFRGRLMVYRKKRKVSATA